MILGLSAAFFAGAVPRAHAQGPFPGPCPANPSPPPNSVPCLSIIPQEQTNLTPGSTITLKVNFTNFPSFNAWDIAIKTNQAVLNPKSISVVETFGGTFSPTSNCINAGGPLGCSANDGGGVAHSAGFSLGASDAGSGTLFTITYAVVAGPTTDVTYVNTPAETSSVSAPDGSFVVDCSTTPNQCITGSASVVTPSLVSVVQGTGGALFWSSFTGTWSSWQSLSGTSNFSPAVCSPGAGSAELVVTGTDGQLYHKSFSSGAWSTTWDVAAGAITGQPSCAVLNGVLYVVARAPDSPGSLWTAHRSLPTGAWSTWGYLAGASPGTPVLVATPSANRLDLVVRGDDNQVWHAVAPGGTFTLNSASIWLPVRGGTTAAPAVVSDGTVLDIAVQGLDSGVWYNTITLSTNAPGTWTYLNAGTSAGPSLALDAGGNLNIVAVGQNGGIYQDTKPSGGTPGRAWNGAPNGLTSATPAVSVVGNSLVVLVVGGGTDTGLYFNSLTGTSWGTWASANGASVAAPQVAHL